MSKNEVMEDYFKLQRIEEEMISHIEKISRAFSLPKIKGVLAKQKVSDAVQIMSGTRNASKIRQFDPSSREKVMKLVDELGAGRACVLLLRKEDGSGVVEMLTGKEYHFEGR